MHGSLALFDESVEPPIRVMALHALLYCERLFYLEEVEEIRVADDRIYAGRKLHDEIAAPDDETPERRSLEVASHTWGLYGRVDAVRRRDGFWVVYEHKRGRCRRGENGEPTPWPSDRIQVIAYAVLLEEALGETVPQGRIRYHADNLTALVDIDEAARADLWRAVERARLLRRSSQRPGVAENESLCRRCSLAPVCLPEEERLPPPERSRPVVPTLFPSNRQRETLHVVSHRARVGRSGESLTVSSDDGRRNIPIHQVDSVIIHGFGQISTQALHLCMHHEVAVQWVTRGGRFLAGTADSPGRVRQRIRQFQALTDAQFCLGLARRLVHAKVEGQLRYLLRATRGGGQTARSQVSPGLEQIRQALRQVGSAESLERLRGLEGIAAKAYFGALPYLLAPHVPGELVPQGRSKRPPRDRFNCLLGFGYAMIAALVQRSILAVGLQPAFGFYHQPRSAAGPLVLDLMELFRTPLWDMPLLGSINRGQWDLEADFEVGPGHVWLSDAGRRKAIRLFEDRLEDSYKHPHTGRSLTYARIAELEVRLLEKEWSGYPGLFGRLRLR